MAAARATRTFPMTGDPWPVVDGWARNQGYRAAQQAGDGLRVYQKGSGLLVAPRKIEISAASGEVHLEAYVSCNVLVRALSLFLLPREITVESGGMKAAIPRSMGRTEVNGLLQAFGQAPVS